MIRFCSEGSLNVSVIYGWASADLLRFTSSRAAEPRPGSNTLRGGPCVGATNLLGWVDLFRLEAKINCFLCAVTEDMERFIVDDTAFVIGSITSKVDRTAFDCSSPFLQGLSPARTTLSRLYSVAVGDTIIYMGNAGAVTHNIGSQRLFFQQLASLTDSPRTCRSIIRFGPINCGLPPEDSSNTSYSESLCFITLIVFDAAFLDVDAFQCILPNRSFHWAREVCSQVCDDRYQIPSLSFLAV